MKSQKASSGVTCLVGVGPRTRLTLVAFPL